MHLVKPKTLAYASTVKAGFHRRSQSLPGRDSEILDKDFFQEEERWSGIAGKVNEYHLEDYSKQEVIRHYRGLRSYCLRLRDVIRRSKSARQMRELEVRVYELEHYERWYTADLPEHMRLARSEIGRKGGSASTKRKSAASRENGKRPPRPGSRPRGRPSKDT